MTHFPGFEKTYNKYDSHLRLIIDAFAMIRAQREYEASNQLNQMLYSMLYNCYSVPCYHTDIIQLAVQPSSNVMIKANDMYSCMISSIRDIYCVHGMVTSTILLNDNLQIAIELHSKQNLKGITLFTSSAVINAIFHSGSAVTASIANRQLYSTTCICTLSNVSIYDYCFYNVLGNCFTITDINLQGIDKQLIINIPVQHLNQDVWVKCNTVFCNNQFRNTIKLDVIQPNKYALVVPTQYNILNVLSVYTDDGYILSAKESIDGWYTTKEYATHYLHINATNKEVYVELLCRTTTLRLTSIAPVEYKPLAITSAFIVQPYVDLCSYNYINRLIMVMQSYTTNNYHAVFELLKTYVRYSNLQYTLNCTPTCVVDTLNTLPYVRQGMHIHIQCNVTDIAFRHALSNELYKYTSVVKVTW